jgi:ribosomal protein RSM22 (predicted rRNA methylase)
MITLPTNIDKAITDILAKNDPILWLRSANSLSSKYRAERITPNFNYIKDFHDALGYLALRASSTYSQIYGALQSVRELNPNWKPESILDLGSGPGTAIWAAEELFPSLNNAIAVERDKNFINSGQEIAQSLNNIKVEWQQTDLSKSLPKLYESFDLIIIANVLNEMDKDGLEKTVNFVKNHCNGIIIIIEPGTPYGYEVITAAENKLHNPQLTLIAPYIKNTFIDSSDVNFIQRIKRPDFQKRVRQTQRKKELDKTKLLPPSDWEESKYYYIAYSKFKSELFPTKRLLDKPKQYKPFMEIKVLTKDGIKTEQILKRDKLNYRLAKKAKWGDVL